jgi:hypothetical protein
MTMKSFCFRVENGTYRLNFGIENDALRSRGALARKARSVSKSGDYIL